MRLVVCAVGGERGFLELSESRLGDTRPFISGGERSLYELAVAAASLGVDVELRGDINAPILGELTAAAGASPRVGLPPRPPEPDDVVVMPEATERETLAAVHLSAARGIVFLLAPPGLFGPAWLPDAAPVDPLTVDVDSVGRPETFAAWADLGLTLWTNARGIAVAGSRAGVEVEWLGTGSPVAPAEPVEKTFDVAIVEANRWAPLADEVAARLEGVTVLRVAPTPSVYSLGPSLAPARILLWPSRVEGMSRIAREARSVGTVPVMLDTNPFVIAEDYGRGCALVPDLDALTEMSSALLADRDRLQALADEGREGAKEQFDWARYVERVVAALDKVDKRPAATARARLGDDLRAGYTALSEHAGRLDEYLEMTREVVRNLEARDVWRIEQAQELGRAAEAARHERDEAVRRGAAAVAQAEGMTEALAVAQRDVAAYRARRIIRWADQSRLARLFSRARPGAR